MKLSFCRLFLCLSIINLSQCRSNTRDGIIQKLYNATYQTLLSVTPPLCSQILVNENNIQSEYISPNGLTGRILPLGTFKTRVLALEYLYGLICPIPNFPPPQYTIVGFDLVRVTYDQNYLITQNEYILNISGNVRLTVLAAVAFDQNYKLCGYDGQVRNPGLTFDPFIDADPQGSIQSLCGATQMFCNGTLQQYDSVEQCIQYLTTNVTYGTNDRTDQGNVACRLIHIKFVPLLPSVHCPHVGPTGGNACYNKTIDFYYNQPDFLGCAYQYSKDLIPGGD